MSSNTDEKVKALRQWMHRRGMDAFIIPSTDPHCGEYIPEHWMARQWVSGFDGSAGTAVVTLSDAALWTDSRYFIAAEKQLDGTPFRLMKDGLPGTPTVSFWLAKHLKRGNTACLDGEVSTVSEVRSLGKELEAAGISLKTDRDPFDCLWVQRPSIPQDKVEIHPLEYAGETAESKLMRLRDTISRQGAEGIVITQLDEIAWLLNMRGTDVHCNPVFVSYLLVMANDATLFIDPAKLSNHTARYLRSIGVETRPYTDVFETLGKLPGMRIRLDPATANWRIFEALRPGQTVVEAPSPVASMKAVKNATEIAGFRQAMLRDGIALVRFLRWLKPAVEAGGETEMSIDRKLTSLRAEQPHFRGPSFDTIAGYGPHGAIVHYEATPETDSPLEPKGLLLLDSGAQYADGTTDITRTIALGSLTYEQQLDYTLVLKGHIRLALTRFPDGISGTRIDAFARYAMWQHGIDYGHGTGHGVGAHLCVHEGPHQIRHTWKPAPLHAGMTVTDEPGIYRAGSHGVRIENTMLIVADRTTDFGTFLRMEPLTLCPIDLSPVVWHLMTADETCYLNAYHAHVYETLSPYLNAEERSWLKEQTREVNPTDTSRHCND